MLGNSPCRRLKGNLRGASSTTFPVHIANVITCELYSCHMRDKRAKFIELANKRVTKCVKDMKLVGNLANRANYEFSDEDTKKIVRALQREVDSIRSRFADNGSAADLDFSL